MNPTEIPKISITVGILLVVAFSTFVIKFWVPALALRKLLKAVLTDLARTKSSDPIELERLFGRDSKLKHLWKEFAETLHAQTTTHGGIEQVATIRSTQPAESYFNSQFVIDSRISTEFFKHLPGILTGLGIIGTFSGLIGGLRGFQAGIEASEKALVEAARNPGASTAMGTANPMQEGLKALLGEVSVAFVVSATAIFFAMVVTAVEKWLLASLYQMVEEIAQDIDARFNAGTGEEYLARIVHASEDSATQAKILKDSLVNDLGDILRDIADRQISAGSKSNEQLAETISRSITDGLAAPLDKISSSVSAASGDQSANAGRLLQDAMAGFSQQVSELFGGQLKGIAALNSGAAENMTEVVQTLNRLVGGIEAASTRSAESMNEQIANAMQRMEQHQQAANAQSAAFVEQLRLLVSDSQAETSSRMHSTIASLGEHVAEMLEAVRSGHERSVASQQIREEAVASRVATTVTTMTGSVEVAIAQLAESSRAVNGAVAEMSRVMTSAIDRMNQGANTLLSATQVFAEAGKSVTGVVTQVATVSGKFTEMSGALASAATAMQTTIADYRDQREAIVALLSELTTATNLARRDLAASSDVIARIETSSQKLAEAQGQVSEYMDGVGEVLVEAQGKFSDATVKALDRVNQSFHKELQTAVNLLATSIGELDTTLAQLGVKR